MRTARCSLCLSACLHGCCQSLPEPWAVLLSFPRRRESTLAREGGNPLWQQAGCRQTPSRWGLQTRSSAEWDPHLQWQFGLRSYTK
jgi:hypothetical protein